MTSIRPTYGEHHRGSQVRLGIVGFGRVAQDYYVPALRANHNIEVAAVAEPLPPSRSQASRVFPTAAVYADCDTMLRANHLDGLLIASPPSTHLDLANQACSRGLAVFLEKPAALTWQLPELEALGRTAPRLMIDFNRRFWPPYRAMAEKAKSSAIGSLQEIRYDLHVNLLQWKATTPHRANPQEGGLLHDLGSHAVDLVCTTVGHAPSSVQATYRGRESLRASMCIKLEYPDGAVAICDLAYSRSSRESMRLTGSSGSLLLRNPNMRIHQIDGGQDERWSDRVGDIAILGYRAWRRSYSMLRYSIAQALATFVASLHNATPLQPPVEDAIANLRILAAAAESADLGRPVKLTRGTHA